MLRIFLLLLVLLSPALAAWGGTIWRAAVEAVLAMGKLSVLGLILGGLAVLFIYRSRVALEPSRGRPFYSRLVARRKGTDGRGAQHPVPRIGGERGGDGREL